MAIWVQTVAECLNCLEEPWDEIHLDHDLGGERRVEFEREDCGMAVIRWIVESRDLTSGPRGSWSTPTI